MLPEKYRLVVRNNTGATATNFTLTYQAWKFDTDGSVIYGAEQKPPNFDDPSNFDNSNEINSGEIVNTSDKYFGIKGYVEGNGGTSGALEVYIEWPGNNGQYPSDGTANPGKNVPQDCIQLAALSVGATNKRGTNFSYE